MISAVGKAMSFEKYNGKNVYFKQGVADTIIKIVKEFS
jgi:hypothetical protein